jgi:hypothetical protein
MFLSLNTGHLKATESSGEAQLSILGTGTQAYAQPHKLKATSVRVGIVVAKEGRISQPLAST